MGKEQELRPCPFCQVAMSITNDYDGDPLISHPEGTECILDGNSWPCDPVAVVRWNRRSSSDEQRAEVVGDDVLTAVWELLQTVHQPTAKAGSDYWHVTAGKHVEFGKLITKLHAMLASPPPAVAAGGVTELRAAAQAVIDQWDTPNWKLDTPTAALINRLRAALSKDTTHAE